MKLHISSMYEQLLSWHLKRGHFEYVRVFLCTYVRVIFFATLIRSHNVPQSQTVVVIMKSMVACCKYICWPISLYTSGSPFMEVYQYSLYILKFDMKCCQMVEKHLERGLSRYILIALCVLYVQYVYILVTGG